jgi:hypothetical protein
MIAIGFLYDFWPILIGLFVLMGAGPKRKLPATRPMKRTRL